MKLYKKLTDKVIPLMPARIFSAKKKKPVSDTMSLDFKSNEKITLGLEMELQIVDKETLELHDVADELIERLKPYSKQFVPEFHKPIIEINSTVHDNVQGLHAELDNLLTLASREADALGCAIIGGGSHPSTNYADVGIRDTARYGELLDSKQWIVRRWMVNGMHIHLAMSSADECLRYMHFFEYFIPHFLALSASSPFWHGLDTGLQSARGKIAEGMPTSDLIYTINSWSQLQGLVDKLQASESIASLKDLHWDIRPSPAFGTLELRIFDMPTNLMDALSIAAFAHALAIWFSEHAEWLTQMPKPEMWMARQNKWRAIRYGLDATIIQSADGTKSISLKDDLEKLFERIEPVVRTYKYQPYIDNLKDMMARGSATDRLRQVYENTGNLQDVVRHSMREFENRKAVYPEVAPVQDDKASTAGSRAA